MAPTTQGNLVHQTTLTNGTTDLTLSAVSGKRTFDAQFSNGATQNVFDYFISHRTAAEWEYGTGHMSSTTILVRDTVVGSSNSNLAVNFSAGTKDIYNDIPAAKQLRADQNLSELSAKYTAKDNISLKGADIAAAATLNLETATGDLIDVTGATGITAITLSEGHERTVRFTGAPLLTHGANLVLQGNEDYQAAAGDILKFRGYASSVVRMVGPPMRLLAVPLPAYTTFVGPASSKKTFTLPNANETLAALGQAQAWTKTNKATQAAITSGAAPDFSTNQAWTINVDGGLFTFANPTGMVDDVYYNVKVTFTTTHGMAFGTKIQTGGYTPSATTGKKDHLSFLYDSTDDLLYLVGFRNDIGAEA